MSNECIFGFTTSLYSSEKMINEGKINLKKDILKPLDSFFDDKMFKDIDSLIKKLKFDFNDAIQSNDLDNAILSILGLNALYDKYINEDDYVKKYIIDSFNSHYHIIFYCASQNFNDEGKYVPILELIKNITAYSDGSAYIGFLTFDFYQNLCLLFQSCHNLQCIIIDVISNTFEEVSTEIQNSIIQLFSQFFKYYDDIDLRKSIVYFIYVIIRKYKKSSDNYFNIIDKSLIQLFLDSFLSFDDGYWFSYYYSFFSIYYLLRRKFIDVQYILSPELVALFNKCMYNENQKVLQSDFVVLQEVVNKIPSEDNQLSLANLFDYKQSLKLLQEADLKDSVVMAIVDFWTSSAACGNLMQNYLRDLGVLSILELKYYQSSFKIQSSIIFLYTNLIPRENLKIRIECLTSKFFLDVLTTLDSYESDIIRNILNIVYFTLTKSKAVESNTFKNALIECGFETICANYESNDSKILNYLDKIVDELNQ